MEPEYTHHDEAHHLTDEQMAALAKITPAGYEVWVNTRTGEEFKVTATPGSSRTWRFGSFD
jgi:hypothetical protein